MATIRKDVKVPGGVDAERDPGRRGSMSEPLLASNDDTLVEDVKSLKHDMIALEDWSQTGRGSHVEFRNDESVPLEQGVFLGRGAMGDVHQVVVQGHKLALKRTVIKRKLGGKEKREIEILKRLSSHEHIIQLVGTYTHRQFLGLLLYPVAVCDLHTFFEDVEAWHDTGGESDSVETRKELLDTAQKGRLNALGFEFPTANKHYHASPVYSKIGCLISALSYLHDEKIRHKDLKPSNILLSKSRMWLSDFGSATDFSLLSQSATDNERGTPRYFSPEMATWKPNGRASDIFSLGCVLLEIVVLHEQGTLHQMRLNRSPDPAFQANLDRVDAWMTDSSPRSPSSLHARLVSEVKSMLVHDPEERPTARELLIRVTGYDVSQMITSKHSVFGDCCRSQFVLSKEHERDRLGYTNTIASLRSDLQRARDELSEKESQIVMFVEKHTASSLQLLEEQKLSNILVNQIESLTSRMLELHQTYSEEFERLKTSALEGDRENTTDAKASNIEWQSEKHQLEQRVAELETQLGSRVAGTPTSSTFGYDEPGGQLAELSGSAVASADWENRSSLIASWPRERTRLEEEVQKTSQGPELIYDWTIGGYRRKTEQETWARINGETDVETLNERQVNMRRRQHIELAKNGLIYEITNESQVSRRREQYMKLAKNGPHATGSTAHHKLGTNLAATNKDTGEPAQQDLKSLRSRIAAALKTGE